MCVSGTSWQSGPEDLDDRTWVPPGYCCETANCFVGQPAFHGVTQGAESAGGRVSVSLLNQTWATDTTSLHQRLPQLNYTHTHNQLGVGIIPPPSFLTTLSLFADRHRRGLAEAAGFGKDGASVDGKRKRRAFTMTSSSFIWHCSHRVPSVKHHRNWADFPWDQELRWHTWFLTMRLKHHSFHQRIQDRSKWSASPDL